MTQIHWATLRVTKKIAVDIYVNDGEMTPKLIDRLIVLLQAQRGVYSDDEPLTQGVVGDSSSVVSLESR